MKKKGLSFNYITLTLICQLFLCLILPVATAKAKDVNNFNFDSFEADYYIKKDADNSAKMHVVEKFTATFPEKQNKGICREIPYLGQNGARTLPNLSRDNITITRNGTSEPIYSIEKETDGGYYRVCTGTEEYIEGVQAFVFEYDFYGVATEYSKAEKNWQEIYWNTNGTGWMQHFETLTARVHFENPEMLTGETSCYVGKSGAKGIARCKTTKNADGFQFAAEDLRAYENLTFDIELKQGSYAIKAPEKSNIMYAITAVVVGFCALILFFAIRKFNKTSEKRKFYKQFFVAPQYTAPKDFNLLEMAKVYIGKTKDEKVAVLLDMIVNGKIEIVENGKNVFGKKWAVIPKVSANNMQAYERYIIEILNGGNDFVVDEKIEIKRQSADGNLIALGKLFDENAKKTGKIHGLFEEKEKAAFPSAILWLIIIVAYGPCLAGFLAEMIDFNKNNEAVLMSEGVILENFVPLTIACSIIFIVSIIIKSILISKYNKVVNHTLKGLEMSRYMDGLKLYITMAEKDRLKFLQSVEGAPRDEGGIVKLNEKLLPYAALFGVEESWMRELAKYYELKGSDTPIWYNSVGVYNIAAFSSALHTTSSYVTSSSHYSSSGSSGGGGGGHSGGGGGGGGGGGR